MSQRIEVSLDRLLELEGRYWEAAPEANMYIPWEDYNDQNGHKRRERFLGWIRGGEDTDED